MDDAELFEIEDIESLEQGVYESIKYELPAAEPAPPGDATVGLNKILNGDLMTCGFPRQMWDDNIFGVPTAVQLMIRSAFQHGRSDPALEPEETKYVGWWPFGSYQTTPANNNFYLNTNNTATTELRNTRNRNLAYNITDFDAIDLDNDPFEVPFGYNGADVVNLNCFTCHGGYLNGKLTGGMPDVARDFTQGFWPSIPLTFTLIGDPFYSPTEINNSVKMLRNLAVWGTMLNMNVVGANVANQLGQFLAQHHETDLSFRYDVANPSYFYYDTDPNTEDRVPASVAKMTIDAAPWWRVKKKSALFYNGSTRGFHHGSMALASSLCVDDPATADYVTDQFPDVQKYVETRPVPVWPFAAPSSSAVNAGEIVYNQHCASCHGTYDKNDPNNDAGDTYTPWLIKAEGEDGVGTDYVWARQGWYGNLVTMNAGINTTAYADVTSLTPWVGTFDENNEVDPTVPGPFNDGGQPPWPGYSAPPLDGIWASAPYFHNGSVPDLQGVLLSSDRPTTWKRNCGYNKNPVSHPKECSQEYNTTRVGWKWVAGTGDKFSYDTTKWSQGNGGHTYGDSLTTQQRSDLLQYLKKL